MTRKLFLVGKRGDGCLWEGSVNGLVCSGWGGAAPAVGKSKQVVRAGSSPSVTPEQQ